MSHPQMSDGAIARSTGLTDKTVAAVRRRSAGAGPQPGVRVGLDGRVRPLNGMRGRERAAALLSEQPEASLRQVARKAGVSPATVSDVRKRLARGEEPASSQSGAAGAGDVLAVPTPGSRAPVQQASVSPDAVLERLQRDPSLRQREYGRRLLRLLHLSNVAAQEWSEMIDAVPPHWTPSIANLAQHYGRTWLGCAQELEQRTRTKCRPTSM